MKLSNGRIGNFEIMLLIIKNISYVILLVCTFFLSMLNSAGQDTVKVEPSIFYTSEKEPQRGKDFASRVKYAREDIIYSDKHRRIEYCYYYDNDRHCYGNTYNITSDSTIQVDENTWKYTLVGSNYFMEQYFEGTYISGYANSLIPLTFVGTRTTATSDKIDTLWSVNFDNSRSRRGIELHKTNFYEKVFNSYEVDTPPSLLNGDSLAIIHLERTDVCISSPRYFVNEIQFVVTKSGRIVNIEQSIGNIDIKHCPEYVLDLMRYLVRLGPLRPATVKGKNVDVLWKLKVDMNEEDDQD